MSTGTRWQLLAWLSSELATYGLSARVVLPDRRHTAAVLRVVDVRTERVRFVVCVPAPQLETWAWVWSEGWAAVADPGAVEMIARAMRR
jgi:hypothetical protein